MIKAYFASRIRAERGEAATDEEIAINVERGVRMGRAIRGLFPELDLFIPHEHEAVLYELRKMGKITGNDIVKAYCETVKEKELLIIYLPVSEGTEQEAKAAREACIPIVSFTDLSAWQTREIQRVIKELNIPV